MKTFHSFIVLIFLSACSLPTETLTPTASGNLPITQSVLLTSTSIPTNTITPKPSPTASATNTQTTEPIPTTEPTLTPEPTKTLFEIENLDHIPIRSIQCIDVRLCYHMRVKEDKQEEAWKQVISSFAVSPMLEDFWKDLGVNEPNPESVEAFLSTSVGGPEESAYWLPSETPNEIPFMMLQGRYGGSGEFVENRLVKESGGVYLDKIGFAAFSLSDWRNTESEERGWFNELMKSNYRSKGSTLHDAGRDGNPYSLYGPVLFDNHFVFITGSKKSADFDTEWNQNLEWKEFTQLGGVEESFRPDFDPNIAQAYWDTYWKYTSEWWQTEEDWSYKNLYICILKWPGGKPKVNIYNVTETIFEPIE